MYKLGSLAISLLLVTSALAKPFDAAITEPCGNNPTSEQVAAMEKHFVENKLVNGAAKHDASLARNIQVYWHVISTDGTPNGGNISTQQIINQMTVLNQDYAPMNITWTLASIDRRVNSTWYNNVYDTQSNLEMRQALRRGGAAALNVYSLGSVYYDNAFRVGYSSFPADYGSFAIHDGIALLFTTLPGGSAAPYNLGKASTDSYESLSHEAGHWVGLYHTFQGGCSYPNDEVDDTPAESSFASGCPVSRDSCTGPSFPGLDLVRNHMDYTDDSCKNSVANGFTSGQITRASQQLTTYRGI